MPLPRDARHIQIAILTCLLIVGAVTLRVDVQLLPALIALIGCQILGIICHIYHQRQRPSWQLLAHYDPRSPLITSLSLTLLLRSSDWWVMALAVLVAISSKSLLRIGNAHIFNPANIGIVAALLLTNAAWISPGQWGHSLIIGLFLMAAAAAVLARSGSGVMSLFFFTSYAALLFTRALWLGDPLAIPLHQLQSGALLIFTFFMISDPKTIPASTAGRLAFAALTALIAYLLQFELYIREGIIYALAITSMLRAFLTIGQTHAPRYFRIHQHA